MAKRFVPTAAGPEPGDVPPVFKKKKEMGASDGSGSLNFRGNESGGLFDGPLFPSKTGFGGTGMLSFSAKADMFATPTPKGAGVAASGSSFSLGGSLFEKKSAGVSFALLDAQTPAGAIHSSPSSDASPALSTVSTSVFTPSPGAGGASLGSMPSPAAGDGEMAALPKLQLGTSGGKGRKGKAGSGLGGSAPALVVTPAPAPSVSSAAPAPEGTVKAEQSDGGALSFASSSLAHDAEPVLPAAAAVVRGGKSSSSSSSSLHKKGSRSKRSGSGAAQAQGGQRQTAAAEEEQQQQEEEVEEDAATARQRRAQEDAAATIKHHMGMDLQATLKMHVQAVSDLFGRAAQLVTHCEEVKALAEDAHGRQDASYVSLRAASLSTLVHHMVTADAVYASAGAGAGRARAALGAGASGSGGNSEGAASDDMVASLASSIPLHVLQELARVYGAQRGRASHHQEEGEGEAGGEGEGYDEGGAADCPDGQPEPGEEQAYAGKDGAMAMEEGEGAGAAQDEDDGEAAAVSEPAAESGADVNTSVEL